VSSLWGGNWVARRYWCLLEDDRVAAAVGKERDLQLRHQVGKLIGKLIGTQPKT
jgi:hypothetical protein